MIKLRHQQPSLWHRGLAEDIEGLWEPWMLLVDKLLEDEQLLDTVYVKALDMHNISRIISAVISFSREEAYAAIF